jgi:hypothetical protein
MLMMGIGSLYIAACHGTLYWFRLKAPGWPLGFNKQRAWI